MSVLNAVCGPQVPGTKKPTSGSFINANITHQNAFFASLNLFMNTWGLTDIDIDLEYPAADDRNGRPQGFAKFPKFLANLKAALSEYKFGLSITLPASYWYLQHFGIVAIEPSVDWLNLMTYDLHGTWDIGNEWTGAYLRADINLTEIETALGLLRRNNIKLSKLNMSVAFYSRRFTLQSLSTPSQVIYTSQLGLQGPAMASTLNPC